MKKNKKLPYLYFIILIYLLVLTIAISIGINRFKEEKDLSDIKSTSGIIEKNGYDEFMFVIIDEVRYEFQYGARWSVDTDELNKIIEVGKSISFEYIELKNENEEVLNREIVSLSQDGEVIFTLENYKQNFEDYKRGTGRIIITGGGIIALIIVLAYAFIIIFNSTNVKEKTLLSGLKITNKGFILRSTNLSYGIVYIFNFIFVLGIIIILGLYFSSKIAFTPFMAFLSLGFVLESCILFALYSVNRLMFKLENEKYYYRKTFGKVKEIAIKDISKIIIDGIAGECIKIYDKNNNVIIKTNSKYLLTGGAFLNSILVRNIPCKFLRFYSISYCVNCIEQEIKYDPTITIKKIFEDKKLNVSLIMYNDLPDELFNLISVLKVLNLGSDDDYEYLTGEINKIIEESKKQSEGKT